MIDPSIVKSSIKIYPEIEICQIYYHSLNGDYKTYVSDKYQKNKSIQPSMIYKEFRKIQNSVNYANDIGLEVHLGHGITFSSAKLLSKIKGVKEFNIGHFII